MLTAAFIAAARTAVPDLITEVRRLRDALNQERDELAEADDYARKLTALIQKHFPGVEPGCIKQADEEIAERLARMAGG
jgi:DNA repair ATPase RecN